MTGTERNGNAYDRGDYNSSFALRAVEVKSENPDRTAPRSSLIWLCTVCPDLYDLKLRIITVDGQINKRHICKVSKNPFSL